MRISLKCGAERLKDSQRIQQIQDVVARVDLGQQHIVSQKNEDNNIPNMNAEWEEAV